ncbi:hypothetical protein HMPREF9094_1105 [Fusobacterium animalis ATCC 51191]|uniref:Uncharacterized protein n=1 Tax=Fusobacterium animalis ATCC 51191 TaxID=997347 RepID=F9EMF0_9FUSO|nr:hypothetical protein HMPREF9094_1105 [Fusobacterium animalis ATCC 51191]
MQQLLLILKYLLITKNLIIFSIKSFFYVIIIKYKILVFRRLLL